MSGAEDFDAVVETYHEALRAIISGDPSGYKALYSQAEDVTLANPFGGVARGRAEIEQGSIERRRIFEMVRLSVSRRSRGW